MRAGVLVADIQFMPRSTILTLFAALAGATHASISRDPAARVVDFAKDVQPILEEHCFDCHGEDKQKSELRLDTVAGILRGGDSGEPLFVAGNSAESYLIKRVTSHEPEGRHAAEGRPAHGGAGGLLRAWIDDGAKMPGEEAAADSLKLKTDHWSFQPVKRPAGAAIDEFVLAKLREKGLDAFPTGGPGDADSPAVSRDARHAADAGGGARFCK